MLRKLLSAERKKAAELLADYWKERGMNHYGRKWAEDYLIQGHTKERAKDEFFVLEEKGKMIGIVSLLTDVSGLIEIRDFIVRPEFRGKGYGKKILKELIEIAQKRECHKIFALVFPEYEKLFLSLGFEKEGLLKNHFKKGEHLAVMSRFLYNV